MRRFIFSALIGCLFLPIGTKAANSIEVNGTSIAKDAVYTQPFCVDQPIVFHPQGDCIDRIEWSFGDGTTMVSTADEDVQHSYSTTNWYPIEARIYCATTMSEEIYSFTIRAIRPDTVVADAKHVCFTIDEYNADKAHCDELIANGSVETQQAECWDTVYVYYTFYGVESEEEVGPFSGLNSVEVYGKTYYSDADVVDTLINEQGCNHYRRYHVSVVSCLEMSLLYPNEMGDYQACLGDNMDVMYTKSKGTIQSARFKVEGVLDEALTISNDNVANSTITLPTSKIKKPGRYHGVIAIDDQYCDPLSLPLDFDINYPSSIFKYKFTNVLAVYNKEHNGGYEFTGYQWYLNGRAIEGATQAVYYHGKPFSVGDEVYVELTDVNGLTLPSCPQTIEEVPDYSPQPAEAQAQKMMLNNRIVIRQGGRTFDIYGQRVQ